MYTHILTELDQSDAPHQLAGFKQAIASIHTLLADAFHTGVPAHDLVHQHAHFVDAILQRAWRAQMPSAINACLVAVGGYGRAELHPGSDIDLLLLTEDDPHDLAAPIENLITFLWDIGLEAAHSVRNLTQCLDEARQDVTVMTNLLESRYLVGQRTLFEQLKPQLSVENIWPSADFFSAKLAEQRTRHAKSDDSGYKLEPNVKTSPGGLRDIQMIGWVAKRHFAANHLADLQTQGFLTEAEYRHLQDGQYFLWQVRYALHVLTGRQEDRLLFEHQRALATMFGYQDTDANLAVERFMQRYYRTVLKLERLNEMLLQWFQEAILLNNKLGKPQLINRRFQARGGYIEVINPATFARYPLAMLEIFLLLQQRPDLQGVRGNTIRAIRAHRHLIDAHLRQDIRAQSLFMEILRQPQGITHALRRMHRYGILSRYLPAFHRITGLMQFDLFHVYTVDQHILAVLRNMRRFALSQHQTECPSCHAIWRQIPKPELLYLASLFHDIAKGRGGDHSALGALDAQHFCTQHQLPYYDSALVVWLVKQHLIMSTTAQRKDIDDPEVIRQFANEVGDIQHLNHLYLLTIADMRGTNPARWNSWKASLLQRLYERTLATLQRGLDKPQNEDQLIESIQQKARRSLANQSVDETEAIACWAEFFSTDYFLQTAPSAIAWHTTHLLESNNASIQVRMRKADERGCHEIFIFGPERDGLFAEITTLLDQMAANILAAQSQSSTRGIAVGSFYILEENGAAMTQERRAEIVNYLAERLNMPASNITPCTSRRMPRQLKNFVRDTHIQFEQDAMRMMTVLTLTTHDRPGLLTLVSTVLVNHQLRIHMAQVATEGAIARDRFSLTDHQNRPVTDTDQLNTLKQALIDSLDGEL
jgi:[protein-PII] uridylyltransferase